MIWLVLAIVVIGFIVMIRNRSQREPAKGSEQHEILLPSVLIEGDAEEEYMIAVITAAIHEFTGTGEFEVVKIKPSAQNWTLTGRQNLLANR